MPHTYNANLSTAVPSLRNQVLLVTMEKRDLLNHKASTCYIKQIIFVHWHITLSPFTPIDLAHMQIPSFHVKKARICNSRNVCGVQDSTDTKT